MNIAAITPFTLLDFPDHLATTIYMQGCNRNCSYCHNSDMIPEIPGVVEWGEAFEVVRSRAHLIDAVVFSGGEPLLQHDLIEKMSMVKHLGLQVGLHTNGDKLTARVAQNCDYILLSHPNRNKIAIASLAKRVQISRVTYDGAYVNKIEELK